MKPASRRWCRSLAAGTRSVLAAGISAVAAWGGTPSESRAAGGLTFERDVRPILKAHCFDCHGEGEKLRGGLDLRLRRLIVAGGDEGPAIRPGAPAESLLMDLVDRGEMPKRERKLTSAEADTVRRWIAAGAPTARPEPEQLARGMQITEEERSHWAFQPLRRPAVPAGRGAGRVRTPIDGFIGAGLARAGLEFSRDAERRVLIRRLYLDLWGLPPLPEEVRAFEADASPRAYEALVDRLLDSPHYGERWARHWLDAAGYADSDGYTNEDTDRPDAWRYRDYVIRSLNEDKPFDRFVVEQLAGDELALRKHADLRTAGQDPDTRPLLVATGYLRMAADGTASGGVDQEAARNQVVADTLKILSTSLLGLSVGCAQCHDHRYDPIPQADYYRLRAVIEPAYDAGRWRTPTERRVSLYTDADRKRAATVEAAVSELSSEREAKQKRYLAEALEKHLESFDASLRGPLREAQGTPPEKRTEEQKRLLGAHPSVNIHPGVLYQYNPKAAEDLKSMDAKIADVRSTKPREEFLAVLAEAPGASVPVTRRFHRGDPKQPQEAIGPGTLLVLGRRETPDLEPAVLPGNRSSGRRLALAQWLTSDQNPLLARVWVNRVWMHHFGRGLVGTPADFGLQGEKPTHPELLDWLASVWSAPTEGSGGRGGMGWSLKQLHRMIVTSTVYRQSSAPRPVGERVDPENRRYWRWSLRRLDAEALRDSILQTSGALNLGMFGTPVPVREDAAGQVVVGIDKKEGDNKMPVEVPMGGEEFRRSVYVQAKRTKPLAFMNVFDAPVMEVNCELRSSSTVAPQSLMLMNSGFALGQSLFFARRLARLDSGVTGGEATGERTARRVEQAWWLAYCRPPSREERAYASAFIARRITELEKRSAETVAAAPGAEKPAAGGAKPGGTEERIAPEDEAWASLCQALLSSNEFLYVE